ncbi:hypothetical protein EV652_12818 [Kribbella steppae]|uniref:Uncharacterized protein n=1 Tax=Kribbella steppae TaxID=2512223 RepID=A0A4R2GSE5_9ACTN|nr:hypothetical protein [Kribbella steppae]TCO12847.1 hypothetical protein EV652_12818 [Kribbella steppae]
MVDKLTVGTANVVPELSGLEMILGSFSRSSASGTECGWEPPSEKPA